MSARQIALCALVASAGGCGDPVPVAVLEPPDALGAYAVGHESFTATDPERDDRMLAVDVWYPLEAAAAAELSATAYPLAPLIELESEVAREGGDPAPPAHALLVFSHGYQGINLQSIDLMEALASHGFIVAAPEHTGNAQASPTDDFDSAASQRVPDVSFVIDTLVGRGRAEGDRFFGHVDEGPVGVVGHSFGGMTAIGTKTGWAGAEPDARVAAIVPISAPIEPGSSSGEHGGPNAGFTAEQLERVEVPVLLMGGTEDTDVPIENNAIAFREMTAAPALYEVDVIGANHTHFAGVCDIGDLLIDLGIEQDLWPDLGAGDLLEPYANTCDSDAFPIEEATRIQNLYVIAFFRRHLRGEEGYGRYLTPAYAEGAGEEAVLFFAKP